MSGSEGAGRLVRITTAIPEIGAEAGDWIVATPEDRHYPVHLTRPLRHRQVETLMRALRHRDELHALIRPLVSDDTSPHRPRPHLELID